MKVYVIVKNWIISYDDSNGDKYYDYMIYGVVDSKKKAEEEIEKIFNKDDYDGVWYCYEECEVK